MPTLKKSSVMKMFTDGEKYFTELRWKDKTKTCIRCNANIVYTLSSGRLRCKKCGLTFGNFTRTYLGKLNVPIYEIAHLLYLFALGIPVYRARYYVLVSMKTAHKAYTVFREALYDTSVQDFYRKLKENPELEQELKSYFCDIDNFAWGTNDRSIIIGFVEIDGNVYIFPVSGENYTSLCEQNKIKELRSGLQYVRQDCYIGKLSIVGSHLSIPRVSDEEKTRHTNKKIPKLWNYLRKHLYIYHGISISHHHLFLKELEFRFNNRDQEIFTLLSEQLVKKVSSHSNN